VVAEVRLSRDLGGEGRQLPGGFSFVVMAIAATSQKLIALVNQGKYVN